MLQFKWLELIFRVKEINYKNYKNHRKKIKLNTTETIFKIGQ